MTGVLITIAIWILRITGLFFIVLAAYNFTVVNLVNMTLVPTDLYWVAATSFQFGIGALLWMLSVSLSKWKQKRAER
ncbi:MAG: hypothetical protein AAGA76_10045 [Pseudomonadota bacterium]